MWNQDVIKFTRQKTFIYGGVIKSNCKTGTKLYLSELKIFFKEFISFVDSIMTYENWKTLTFISESKFGINRVICKFPLDIYFIGSFEIHQIQNARYILHKKFLQNIFITLFWEI